MNLVRLASHIKGTFVYQISRLMGCFTSRLKENPCAKSCGNSTRRMLISTLPAGREKEIANAVEQKFFHTFNQFSIFSHQKFSRDERSRNAQVSDVRGRRRKKRDMLFVLRSAVGDGCVPALLRDDVCRKSPLLALRRESRPRRSFNRSGSALPSLPLRDGESDNRCGNFRRVREVRRIMGRDRSFRAHLRRPRRTIRSARRSDLYGAAQSGRRRFRQRAIKQSSLCAVSAMRAINEPRKFRALFRRHR